MARSVALVLIVLAAGGAGAFWWFKKSQPPPPPPPERLLFERKIPGWATARARKDLHFVEMEAAKDLARPWPGIVEALSAIDQAWPGEEKTKAAVAKLNEAARAAGLAYWVDVVAYRDLPYLLTYEVLARSTWQLEGATKRLLRVRRLDHVNIEMGYLGHAGGDVPVVLVDRLEPSVMESVAKAFAEAPEGNAVNQAALRWWRKTVEAKAGAQALAKGAAQVARRERLFRAMRGHLQDGRVVVVEPERLTWGDDFFESLMPATDYRRKGGPLLVAGDVRDLKRADEALREGEGRRALDLALEMEAMATEAHEARHALDPGDLPIPEPLLMEVGEDDLEFARGAERELRAYLGQLHDAEVPPCLTVTRLAIQAGGAKARATPHHYAGTLLLETLSPTGLEGLPKLIEELCTLPEEEVRKKAEAVFKSLYGRPMVAAKRLSSP
ncbi:MAG TPA: hypothetical protein VGK67_18880 [Myxococcales bacterium]